MKMNCKMALMALTLGACLAPASHAQSQPNADDDWHFSLGAGVASAPKYLGSKQQKGVLALLPSASKGRFYVGVLPGAAKPGSTAPTPGLGYSLVQNDDCRLSVGLTEGESRRQSASNRLNGMGDIHPSVNGFVNGSCSSNGVQLNSTVMSDVSGKGHGTSVEAELLGRVLTHSSGFQLNMGGGLTWGDRKFNQTLFGVTAQQSAQSTLPAYNAGSGVIGTYLVVNMEMPLDKHWLLSGGVMTGRLRGAAGDSPLTERKSQTSAVFAATYRF